MSRSVRLCAVLVSRAAGPDGAGRLRLGRLRATRSGSSGSGDTDDRQEGRQRYADRSTSPSRATRSPRRARSAKIKAGKPLKLHITADKPGEIHVHSSPEQEIEYDAGTTDKTLTIDQPGVVDVESHSLDKLIVQLEVR